MQSTSNGSNRDFGKAVKTIVDTPAGSQFVRRVQLNMDAALKAVHGEEVPVSQAVVVRARRADGLKLTRHGEMQPWQMPKRCLYEWDVEHRFMTISGRQKSYETTHRQPVSVFFMEGFEKACNDCDPLLLGYVSWDLQCDSWGSFTRRELQDTTYRILACTQWVTSSNSQVELQRRRILSLIGLLANLVIVRQQVWLFISLHLPVAPPGFSLWCRTDSKAGDWFPDSSEDMWIDRSRPCSLDPAGYEWRVKGLTKETRDGGEVQYTEVYRWVPTALVIFWPKLAEFVESDTFKEQCGTSGVDIGCMSVSFIGGRLLDMALETMDIDRLEMNYWSVTTRNLDRMKAHVVQWRAMRVGLLQHFSREVEEAPCVVVECPCPSIHRDIWASRGLALDPHPPQM